MAPSPRWPGWAAVPRAGPGHGPLTCLMASTRVTVLPVPGGPKMRYGAGLDIPVTMCVTALHCSSFACSLWSNHLREQRLSVPGPHPLPFPPPPSPSISSHPAGTGTHWGWKVPVKRDLWQEAEGKRRLDKPRCMARVAARCWTCSGSRLKVKVTSNLRLFTNFFCSLGRSSVSRAQACSPAPSLARAQPSARPSGAAGALPARLGLDATHLEEKPSLTFSSSTLCT